ncbi:MAG: RNA polymerase sigma factor [Thermomicrobiales bacterium]
MDDAPPSDGGDGLASAASVDEMRLIAGLRARDEAAFVELVARHQPALLRLAMLYVSDRATAEDVVQETWIGVLNGIDGFAGRSAFKTWLYTILMNQARRRGARDSRTIPFSAAWVPAPGESEPSVDPSRFIAEGEDRGHWTSSPRRWCDIPEDRLLSAELRGRIEAAIAALPPTQREVVTLRDVAGWSSQDVCNALRLTEINQRVLLHRGRSKVRRALEGYLGGGDGRR